MVALCLGTPVGGIEKKFWRDKKEANRRQGQTAEDIDHVMLMSQECGKTYQHEPKHHRGLRQTAQMPRIGVDQEKQERGVSEGKRLKGAREVMELFTLGIGHYSEEDIRESAGASTGYRINLTNQQFRFEPRQQDTGRKKFLGQSGNFLWR